MYDARVLKCALNLIISVQSGTLKPVTTFLHRQDTLKKKVYFKWSKLSSWLRLPNLPYCVPIKICEWLKRCKEWFTLLLKCEPEGDISYGIRPWASLKVISYILGNAGTRSITLIWNFFIKPSILDKFTDTSWTGMP